MNALLIPRPQGVYCPAGDFYVDPWRPVERAVLTHAHADHARFGSRSYLCAEEGLGLARQRVGADARVETLRYGQTIEIGAARVSLHPAGHVLGSAQIRIEHRGEVWVASGDYKVAPDPTCAPFEPVRCDVFLTESTFALPVYRWEEPARIFARIDRWRTANQAEGRTSVLFGYALGKAGRILASVDASLGPILVHGAIARFVEPYRAAGVRLPEVLPADETHAKLHRGRALVVAPPSARGSPWLRKFGPVSQAMASGWMQVRGTRRRQGLDAGFALSDHADWPGLLQAIEASGAPRVLVTHGACDPLVRWLREHGREASAWRTEWAGEDGAEADGAEGGDEGTRSPDPSEPAVRAGPERVRSAVEGGGPGTLEGVDPSAGARFGTDPGADALDGRSVERGAERA